MKNWGVVLLLLVGFVFSNSVLAVKTNFSVVHSSANCDGASFKGQMNYIGTEVPTFIESLMEKHQTPGVTMGIVQGDCAAFWGFGLADVETGRVVDPLETGFRIGSITKTFTATAILQLVEKGLLDLDADIEQYLPGLLKPSMYDQTITIRHLLSHTAGFEDAVLGIIFFDDPSKIMSLKDYVTNYQPNRVRPPGEMTVYSNYSYAVAGHIVATVSGKSYEEYIKDHILVPLGMDKTVADEMLVNKATYSAPYLSSPNGPVLQKQAYLQHGAPAGVIISTAEDMVAYMRAHLNRLRGSTAPIYGDKAQTIVTAWREEKLGWNNAFLGFVRSARHGNETIGHGGATPGFGSYMMMVPEQGLGIFISANNMGGSKVNQDVASMILDALLEKKSVHKVPVIDGVDLSQYAGLYISERRSYTQAEAFVKLATGTVGMSVKDGHYLSFPDGASGKLWEPIGLHTFREKGGDRILRFKTNESGAVQYAMNGSSSAALYKLTWYEQPVIFIIIYVLAVISFLTSTTIMVRKRIKANNRQSWFSVPSLTLVVGSIGLLTVISLAIAMARAALAPGITYVYGFPDAQFVSMLWLMIVLVICVTVFCVQFVKAAVTKRLTIQQTGFYGLFLAISVCLLMWLHHLNLIGFNYFIT